MAKDEDKKKEAKVPAAEEQWANIVALTDRANEAEKTVVLLLKQKEAQQVLMDEMTSRLDALEQFEITTETVEEEPELTNNEWELVGKACKAYGIPLDQIFSDPATGRPAASVREGVVTVLTNGGAKVRWKKGDEVEELEEIAVTGVNPKAAKRKVIVGKGTGKPKKK